MHVGDPHSTSFIPVCAIGASAGGIEALTDFFHALPADLGAAYVVVVHLPPDHKSELPAILAKRTKMPVIQLGDHEQAAVQADHVYVLAPDRKLHITETSFIAQPFDQPRGHRMSIDLLFRTLAHARPDGFAIILSGTGSDGTAGAREIKAGGGLVLVQAPEEAEYSEMPRAVIATGIADVILPVRQLAACFAKLMRNRGQISSLVTSEGEPHSTSVQEDKALRDVFELLRKSTGHDFSKYKRSTVLRRLSRRMQLAGQSSIDEYLQYLRAHSAEARALFGDFLICVTSFFRESDAWAALATEVIGPLLERINPDEQIRIWVPGCSTGEEAYTVAILFHEEAGRRRLSINHLLIFATDIDEKALSTAREGLFPQAIAADLSQTRLERFFRREDEHFRVVSEIRDRIVFAAHDLLRDPPFSKLSLISCRNLLIYLDRDLQDQVMGIFRYALRDQGYLFLGASEAADDELFQALDTRHRIFVARSTAGVRIPLPELLTAAGPGSIRYGQDSPRPSRASALELHVAALEQAAPPSALIDERGNVVHLSASAARFFQQGGGPPARRLTDMVRPELRDELHALINRAIEDLQPHASVFVPVTFDGACHAVAMIAQHRPATKNAQEQILVTFLDGGRIPAETASLTQEPSNELVRDLREKLRQSEQRFETMREEYFSINEDLRAANEELQSLNEEYRSTTEELETSKEELQSVNEELQTVNNELKLKLEEVSRAHSDLENLMSATDVATLFLDRELRIKRFTPRLGEFFNVKLRDYERPIGDLTHNLDYDNFEQDARLVLNNPAALEREVHSRDGRTFVARLSPYRLAGGRDVDGVVITFVDVTAIKAAESALRMSEARLADELDLVKHLHRMSTAAATAGTIQEALERIIAAAIEVQHADFGTVQLIDGASSELRIVAQRGFTRECVERIRALCGGDTTTFGRAVRTRARVQIADVALGDVSDACREAAAACGYRCIQVTPLINRAGLLLGVLSVHFREPHAFSERDAQLGDLICRQAADLVEGRRQQDRLTQLVSPAPAQSGHSDSQGTLLSAEGKETAD